MVINYIGKKQYSSLVNNYKNTLSFIKRNLPKASKHIKENCYKTLIRPKAEYACAVWDPHHKKYINDIEKIQKSAARYVTGNYLMESGNSEINLNSLGWPTLEEKRQQTKINIFQKGRLGDIDIPTDHLILKGRQTRRGGGGPTYQREFSDIDSHIHSFYPSTSRLWNNLPLNLRICTDLKTFSKQLQEINLTELINNFKSID